ncbi:MAG: hypothetical protein LN590_07160 [Rickettsia endosymbiont of Glossina mortisans submortisans]|nr:hypothetical protein [Rickettsia endosymbiont of Glossina mortisans submortisans]
MTLNEILMSLEIGIIYGIIAMGIYLTFRIINFPDLTCEGSFVLGAAISTTLIKLDYNPWLTIFIALLSGSASGVITGILHIKFKVTDLLSGILATFMLYSVNLRIMGGIPNIIFFDNNTIFSTKPILILGAIVLILNHYRLRADRLVERH